MGEQKRKRGLAHRLGMVAFIRRFFSDLGILTLRFSRRPSFMAFLRSYGQPFQSRRGSTNGFTNLFGFLILVSVSPRFLLSRLTIPPRPLHAGYPHLPRHHSHPRRVPRPPTQLQSGSVP